MMVSKSISVAPLEITLKLMKLGDGPNHSIELHPLDSSFFGGDIKTIVYASVVDSSAAL
jgi:hypothetical protein